jgi:hypothetical protein
MSDKALRKALIKLAHDKPEIRGEILPLLKESGEKKEAAGSVPSTFVVEVADELVEIAKRMKHQAKWEPAILAKHAKNYAREIRSQAEMLNF